MSGLGWLTHFHGFLLLDKPSGITSQDVITLMQRMIIARSGTPPTLRKRDLPRMGHGGTLDPFATGLLVIAVGNGTKLARYLTDSEKAYEAEVSFGARTTSGDLTNEVSERTDVLPISLAVLEASASSFCGRPYIQTPPMYSAKKIEGTPLYELARKGIEVERATVSCLVPDFKVLGTEPWIVEPSSGLGIEFPTVGTEGATPAASGISKARIFARVSAGTYIRTLAEDFAVRAGSLAHLSQLRRTAAGPFKIQNAIPLADLESIANWMEIPNAFIPFQQCLREKIPSLEITDAESQTIIHGLKSVVESLAPRLPENAIRAALYHRHELRAVFLRGDEGWDFERVFHPAK